MRLLTDYIAQMKQLLDELIQVATKLRDVSLQVMLEEDLVNLQGRQDEIFVQLEALEQQMQADYGNQVDNSTKEYIHNQLKLFQELNQEFIKNLHSSHGLIQFELRRLPAENEEFSHFSRLNKVTSSPNSTEAVKSQKSKEKG